MPDDPARPADAGKPLRTERSVQEAELDEILADSFPASDPPPWTLGVGDDTPETPADESRRRRRRTGRDTR
jgi:hypothetical protein